MKRITVLTLIIPVIFLTACKNENIVTPEKEKAELFLIEYVEKNSNSDSVEFNYSMPDDYSHIEIKEKVYQPNEKMTETVIIDSDLDKPSGTIKITKEDDLDNQNLNVLTFEVPITSSTSLIKSNIYPLDSSYFNISGANTSKSNEPKANLFTYKEKRSEQTKESIELTQNMFKESYDVSKNLKEDETLIIWSCEFTKQ